MKIIRKIFSNDNYLGIQAIISVAVLYGLYSILCVYFYSKWPKVFFLLSISLVSFCLIYKKFIRKIWFSLFMFAVITLNAAIVIYFSLYEINSYIIYYPFLLSEIIAFDFMRRILDLG